MDIMDYFKKIASIPRGSTKEKAVSDYIVSFALAHHYNYVQDELGNVVIYAPATSGYEDHETVMLQGHLDIVCEKNNDVDFNFDTQGLNLYEEDGYLKAKGTTLGADDGYAIAYMLSILDHDLPHPALECTFTVQEEIGLVGAKNLKKEYFKATRMINMDSGGEEIVTVSCSGGRRNRAEKTLKQTTVNLNTYTLMITGLKGGHSGGNINKERANAIKLAFKLIKEIAKDAEIYLIEVNGGLKENAIPRECIITFSSDASVKYIDSIIIDAMEGIKTIYEFSDANIRYELRQIARRGKEFVACTLEDSMQVIDFISLYPYGVRHNSMSIPNLVIASDNIGVMRLKDGKCIVNSSIRSPIECCRDEISDEIELLGKMFGFTTANLNDYPGWNYEADSKLRKIYSDVLKEKLGKELKERATHGGLEAGVIKGMLPDLDIITLGPIATGEHTPEEMMNIASFYKMYDVLVYLLSKL